VVPSALTRPENVDRAVDLRLRRQAVLDKATLHLHAVCGEEALRYLAGGRTVRLAQLHHLLSVVSENEPVTLQVMPFSAGLHLGHSGAYTIIDFAHPVDTTVVQLEHAATASFTDAPTDVRLWAYVFDNLTTTALPQDESVQLIESIIREL
jgi:hypothetical protein